MRIVGGNFEVEEEVNETKRISGQKICRYQSYKYLSCDCHRQSINVLLSYP